MPLFKGDISEIDIAVTMFVVFDSRLSRFGVAVDDYEDKEVLMS